MSQENTELGPNSSQKTREGDGVTQPERFSNKAICGELLVETKLEVFKQNQFAGLKPRQGEQVVRDDGLEPPTYSV